MTRATRWPLYTAVLLGGAMATQAGEGGLLDERFSVGLGTFFLSSNTNVRANGFDSGDIGTPIDVEDTFELEDENVFRVDASWRIARRHILRAMYFESDRSRRKVIDEEIEFAGDNNTPTAVNGLCVSTIDRSSFFIMNDRVVNLTSLNQEAAQVVMRLRVIRSQGNRLPVMFDCLIHFSAFFQNDAEIVMRHPATWIFF